jgi:hypothetical protein
MIFNPFVGIKLFWPLCAELYKQIMCKESNNNVKIMWKYLLCCRVLTFQCLALCHCLSIVGGVKWRKLVIFINSALANLPGGVAPGITQIWCKGSRTQAGWKDLTNWPNQGPVFISWCFVGRWTAALLYTLRPYDLMFNELFGLKSRECNSPNKF